MYHEQIDALVSQYLDVALDEVEVRLAEDLPLTNDTGREVLRTQFAEASRPRSERSRLGGYMSCCLT